MKEHATDFSKFQSKKKEKKKSGKNHRKKERKKNMEQINREGKKSRKIT